MPAAPQVFFFTGENAYALQQELGRWKQGFIEKYGMENLERLDGPKQSAGTIMDAVAVMPFIAEKRLVLCDGVPKLTKEEVAQVIEAVHPQTILVFHDAHADKRLSAVKALRDQAQLKEFTALTDLQLRGWIQQQAAMHGCTADPAALQMLVSVVGTDQWMLATEIAKLALGADGKITTEQITLLSVPSATQVVWRLTDLLGSGRMREALSFLRLQVERGEDPYGMWIILLNAIRNLVSIRLALDAGMTQERDIAQSLGVHFLSVRGLLPLARSLKTPAVRRLVTWAAEADIALKSGGYQYTVERPEELLGLADYAILLCEVR